MKNYQIILDITNINDFVWFTAFVNQYPIDYEVQWINDQHGVIYCNVSKEDYQKFWHYLEKGVRTKPTLGLKMDVKFQNYSMPEHLRPLNYSNSCYHLLFYFAFILIVLCLVEFL